MKSVAETYKIIQIGLCLFHEETPSSSDPTAPPRFVARPYNFWLFPEEGAVNMEAAAIAFNKTHGMDFNKWIYEGIPYLTNESHDALMQKFYGGAEGWQKEQVRVGRIKPDAASMTDDSASSSSAEKKEEKPKKQIVLEREADIQYLQDVQSRIFAWLGSRAADEHELLLPEANSFLRLAVHQWFETLTQEQLAAKVPNVDRANVFLETRAVGGMKWKSTFHVMHWTKAEKDEQDALALDKKRREFDAKVGFKLVWDLLKTARAPVVVHNGFFDVLFMFTHFESAQLPATLPEFKQALGRVFPAGVFDTKFLSNSRQFAFPFEFLSKRFAAATANGSTLTAQDQQRMERFKAMNLSDSALTAARFRETHLEKLYFALKAEGEARIVAANANNGAAASAAAPAPVAASASSSAPRPLSAASPPPPLSEVVVTMAPSFDKYALVGQPGGDDSKAHEAGYDAFMTAVIFASFAAEAPVAEILAPMRANRAANVSSIADSARAMQASPWLGRIPLFRHLLALDLNVDPSTGLPRADSLVDASSVIYLMRGFPAEWRADDIARMFEGGNYTCAKRKMGDGNGNGNGKDEKKKTETAAAADAAAMVDVAAPSVDSAAGSSAAPLPVIVTAAPKFIWIDDVSLFLSIPCADQAKFEAFLASNANGANPAVVPAGVSITKFAGGTEEAAGKAVDSAAATGSS